MRINNLNLVNAIHISGKIIYSNCKETLSFLEKTYVNALGRLRSDASLSSVFNNLSGASSISVASESSSEADS